MFTRTFTVPNYNWQIELFEPTTGEWVKLSDSYNDRNWPEVHKALTPMVKQWDCTDRAGNVLPITVEGVAQLPLTVIRWLGLELDAALAADSKPKNPSSS